MNTTEKRDKLEQELAEAPAEDRDRILQELRKLDDHPDRPPMETR